MAIKRHSFEEYDAGCMYHPKKGCVHPAEEGRFISSLSSRRPDLHAPTLDIDYPVSVTAVKGGWTVEIKGPCPRVKEANMLLDVLLGRHLIDHGEWRSRRLDRPSGQWCRLPSFTLSDPTWIHPSSTPGHFHLYIDHEMPWPEYEGLLIALRDAHVIGADFCAMCLKWRVSFLLKPEYKKSDFKLKFDSPA